MLSRLDKLENIVNDYDIVWWAYSDQLRLTCVKQVRTPFKRVNPKYRHSWRGQPSNNEPSHITGVEDKFCMVSTYSYSPNSVVTNPNMHTFRITSLAETLLVNDPYILASPLANALREKALGIKK